MATLKEAEEIISLFKQLDSVDARLAEIALARTNATSISISFKNKNPESRWGDVDGLRYGATLESAGRLNDIAAAVLGRLSDEVGYRKRKIERRLAELGATRP